MKDAPEDFTQGFHWSSTYTLTHMHMQRRSKVEKFSFSPLLTLSVVERKATHCISKLVLAGLNRFWAAPLRACYQESISGHKTVSGGLEASSSYLQGP